MRKIALIDGTGFSAQTMIAFNLAAELARNKKKVLLLDFRIKEWYYPGEVEQQAKAADIYHCMLENFSVQKYAHELEPNLFVLFGNKQILKIEFHLYYELLKRTYFEKYLRVEGYDYIFFLVSPMLNQLTMNVFSYGQEAMSIVPCTPDGYDYQQKMNRFLHYLRKFYAKELFFSKVIPVYEQTLDMQTYGLFTSEMTKLLITPALVLDTKAPGFKAVLKHIITLILDDEKRFDSAYSSSERQKYLDEYYHHLDKEKEREKKLVEFSF
ncbi:MAG: AAA family ATPase [Candidatus Woesearchaeota archaeon]